MHSARSSSTWARSSVELAPPPVPAPEDRVLGGVCSGFLRGTDGAGSVPIRVALGTRHPAAVVTAVRAPELTRFGLATAPGQRVL